MIQRQNARLYKTVLKARLGHIELDLDLRVYVLNSRTYHYTQFYGIYVRKGTMMGQW